MRFVFLTLLLVAATGALARELGFAEFRAMQESLQYLPPNMRFYELDRLGLMPRSPAPAQAESTGLRLAGKWGAGPSVKVTGRDSLVFLSRGSEVVAVNFADTASPQVLSYIQVNGLVSRSVLVGSRLYVGSTGSDPKYIDVFDVSNPANPQRLGQLQTRLLDIDVVDTLVYTVAKDSFRVFDFSDPAHPRQVGACRDSGYDLSVCDGYAYIADRWGLLVVDARDPANPHHEVTWGTNIISVKARGNICCVTLDNSSNPGVLKFTILDVRTPSNPTPLGTLDSCGAYDVFLDGQLAFLSGYYVFNEFRILDISDSTRPQHVGTVATPDHNFGVWANSARNRAYVADDLRGLAAIDISSLGTPRIDTTMLIAGFSEDVSVQGGLCYVASDAFGLVVLDASNPAQVGQIGALDSTRDMVTYSVAASDSFVYMGWGPSRPWLRSVSVADPTRPVKAGGASVYDWPQDMVLRDSLLYVAQRLRFQVVNVARPRQPVLVGSCVIQGTGADIELRDSFAYVAAFYLSVVNVARPNSPAVVFQGLSEVEGLDVVDTIAYLAFDGLKTASVANPAAPYLLDSLPVTDFITDVVVIDTLAVLSGRELYVFSVADPRSIRLLGTWAAPGWAHRLLYEPPYLYAACYDAGVCVLETTTTGIAEPAPSEPQAQRVRLGTKLVRDRLIIEVSGLPRKEVMWSLYTVAGFRVPVAATVAAGSGGTSIQLDLRAVPAGVYVIRVNVGGLTSPLRFVKL